MCKFVIIPIGKGNYYFELETASREILLTSKEFKSAEDCEKKAALVVMSCRNDALFNKKQTSDGKLYFTLEDEKGKLLGTSQLYLTENGRGRGIRLLKETADVASIGTE